MSDEAPPENSVEDVKADISDEEVDALLEKVESGELPKSAQSTGMAEPYDLVSPDKIVRGRMPVLDRINERWMSNFQQRLAELVRQPIEATVQEVQLGPYAEWQATNATMTSFNLFDAKPWQRRALVTIDRNLLYVLVDAYYGGAGQTPDDSPQEELTPTERRLNSIIVELLVTHFRKAFEPIAVLDFELLKTETNPYYVQIATSSETVVVTRLDVALNETQGSICLVFPASSFDPVREKLSEGLKTVSEDDQARWLRSIQAQLRRTELELASVFLETRISMKELLQLNPGDILPIEMPKTATLYAGARPLLVGKFGLSRGYNAIRILGATQDTLESEKEMSEV